MKGKRDEVCNEHHPSLIEQASRAQEKNHDRNNDENDSDDDRRQEQKHIQEVCESFRQHATFARCARNGHNMRVKRLPKSMLSVLPKTLTDPESDEYKLRESIAKNAEIRNQFFFDCMLNSSGVENSQEFQQEGFQFEWSSDENISKTFSVLKSLVREWSAEGKIERCQCNGPLLDAIKKYVPKGSRICVPGAGLGRLATEICALGYSVQGNEFSFHMLLCSSFVLNSCIKEKQFEIYPYFQSVGRNSNKFFDIYRKVLIPDVVPHALLNIDNEHSDEEDESMPDFSMAAGDFVSIYSDESQHRKWGCVSCAFFLDAAPCIAEYLQTIHDMLEDGGYLMSNGPLHYHWTGPDVRPDDKSWEDFETKHHHLDKRYLASIDLCWEDVRSILINIGFDLIEERIGDTAFYTHNDLGFCNTVYKCIFFVAKKKIYDS